MIHIVAVCSYVFPEPHVGWHITRVLTYAPSNAVPPLSPLLQSRVTISTVSPGPSWPPVPAVWADFGLVPAILYAPNGCAELLDADAAVRVCIQCRVGDEQLKQELPIVLTPDGLVEQQHDVLLSEVPCARDVQALAQLVWRVIAVATPKRDAVQNVI